MNAERLAYWYFRLNGFFTFENFIVHPDQGRDQRTDADILAVRFEHREENRDRPMVDDSRVADSNKFANFIIAEVKTSTCKLNGPWTRPENENMQRVVRAMGCVPDESVASACACLYRNGQWADATISIRLIAIGEEKDMNLTISAEQQISWSEIIEFLIQRFRSYRCEKSSVGQWSNDGKILKNMCSRGETAEQDIRKYFKLRAPTSGEETTP